MQRGQAVERVERLPLGRVAGREAEARARAQHGLHGLTRLEEAEPPTGQNDSDIGDVGGKLARAPVAVAGGPVARWPDGPTRPRGSARSGHLTVLQPPAGAAVRAQPEAGVAAQLGGGARGVELGRAREGGGVEIECLVT